MVYHIYLCLSLLSVLLRPSTHFHVYVLNIYLNCIDTLFWHFWNAIHGFLKYFSYTIVTVLIFGKDSTSNGRHKPQTLFRVVEPPVSKSMILDNSIAYQIGSAYNFSYGAFNPKHFWILQKKTWIWRCLHQYRSDCHFNLSNMTRIITKSSLFLQNIFLWSR